MSLFDHLRDYQHACIQELRRRWGLGDNRVPAVLATGLGKTEIAAGLIEECLAEQPDKRILFIAHTDELISQAARKMRQRLPHRTVGIVKGQQHNEVHCQIVISSRQTLQSEKRRSQLRNVGTIIIDECHHATIVNTYGKILTHFGAFGAPIPWGGEPDEKPWVRVAGFTATLVRGDKQKLSAVWQDCTFKRDILFGIRNGFLLDVRGKRVIVPDFDLRNVKQAAGDYQDSALAEELERTLAPQVIAQAYAEHAAGRLGIVFWPLVATAYHGAEAFEAEGIPSAVIHGGLPKEERRLILKKFHAGEIQVVHNCMVLTEGFDEPRADVVVIARPTRSAGLYQQMVGRVLRPDLEKRPEEREKALILDVTGASADNDLRSLIDLAPERPLREVQEIDPDGEMSLLELDDWDEQPSAGSTFFEEEEYAGETAIKEFDPLGRDKLWSRTPDGTWFISAGGAAYVFLAESFAGDPGTWDVVWCTKLMERGLPVKAGLTEHTGLPMELALAFGEDEAVERGGLGTKTLTARKSKWRKDPPTEAQQSRAYRMGIDSTGMTKGELSEAIDNVTAARAIDPLVRTVRTSLSEEK